MKKTTITTEKERDIMLLESYQKTIFIKNGKLYDGEMAGTPNLGQ